MRQQVIRLFRGAIRAKNPAVTPNAADRCPSAAAVSGYSRDEGAALYRKLQAAPARPVLVPVWRAKPPVTVARRILEADEFKVQHHPPVQLARPVTWREDPLSDRNWRFWFHAFSPVSYLIQSYQATAEASFLSRAGELIDGWIETCLEGAWSGPEVWNEHGTALRAMCLLYFWEVQRGAGIEESLAERSLATLLEHARRLARESFYQPRHNHGIDQARALLAIALNLRECDDAREWEALARQRLADQIRHTISADGVHLEHTPDYHHHVYMMLAQTDSFLRAHGKPWPLLADTTRNMLRYLTHSLKPGGAWPNIGDTTPGRPANLAALLKTQNIEADEFFYAFSSGAEGRAPAQRDLVLPESGCAIFRESWQSEKMRTTAQLQFSAAFHSLVHKHRDDLSFVLHGFGLDLLVDGGKFKYDYDHPARKFCESAYAHNVVVRDGQEPELRRAAIGQSGITAVLCGEWVSAVEGEHRLMAGFIVRRLLVWVRPAIIFVVDRVIPAATGFRQLFNVGPELSVVRDREQYSAHENDGVVRMRICPVWPESAQVELVRGQEAPLRGWVSRGHASLEPATSVFVPVDEMTGIAITCVVLNDLEQPVSAFEASANLTTLDAMQIGWRMNDEHRTLRIDRGRGQLAVETANERLISEIRPLPYQRRRAARDGA